jgi:excisionase family DNA binding protein
MMEGRIDAAVVDWARRVPVDQIPCIVAFLSARLLAEGNSKPACEHTGESPRRAQNLLTASELAKHLSLPESWVRTEERAGRIPSFRLGRYVRFRLSDVERSLAERGRQRA